MSQDNQEPIFIDEEGEEPERNVEYEYEVYAGGGMILHQFDDEGRHRLVDWNANASRWVSYTSVAMLPAPNDHKFYYIGVTAYGLFENADEQVFRVERMPKKDE